jgi:NAD(P)-dependent dehydrogenase (short-subunit alcohol dehydrogenase family)
VINTTSHSALFANIGQVNYAAAKSGIAAFSQIAARELDQYGVTVNAIAPRAHTRMTEGLREFAPEEVERRSPDWVAALVTWLASPESRSISGRVFEAWGNGYAVIESWQHGPMAEASQDPTEIGDRLKEAVGYARANAGIDRNTWHRP